MNLIPKINGPVQLEAQTCQFTLPLGYQGECPSAGQFPMEASQTPSLFLETDATLPEEGYALEIQPGRIRLTASAEAGTYYGLQTLFQLLQEGKGMLACGRLQDAPRYGYRGFMLDVSRHFFPVEEVKKILDVCARLKLNHFHWHLSDDQGFRIESKRFPLLNEVGSYRKEADGSISGGYYTQEEIRDIVAYAKERQIEIVPEIDMPGHTTAIIAAYPEYSCEKKLVEVVNQGGIYQDILCGGSEKTYEFLYALLDEVCELFPGQYFHLGGDEAPKDRWKKCPCCQALIEREGLKNEEELQAYFTAKLVNYLASKGKTAIGWNETLASGMLPEGPVAQYWMEMGEAYSYRELSKARRFILSNFYAFYFDYPYLMVTFRGTYEYEPELKGAGKVPEELVMGLEGPLWTERLATNEQIERQIFPRLLALAENAWSKEKDYEDFLRRVEAYEVFWQEKGLAYTPVEQATISGEEGMEQLTHFAVQMFSMFQGSQSLPPEMLDGYLKMSGDFIKNLMKYAYSSEEQQKTLERIQEALQEKL